MLSSSSSSKSANKTWIAGAVIGPLAALAIILSLGIWIYRLRRRLAARNSGPSTAGLQTFAQESQWNHPGPYVAPQQMQQQYVPLAVHEVPNQPARAQPRPEVVEAMGDEARKGQVVEMQAVEAPRTELG